MDLSRKDFEFREGAEAYAEGVDGYAAKPYPEGSQELVDWFAGWLAARDEDLREQALWLQHDAAYTYEQACIYRDAGGVHASFVAPKVQEAAAHSARLARQALRIEFAA